MGAKNFNLSILFMAIFTCDFAYPREYDQLVLKCKTIENGSFQIYKLTNVLDSKNNYAIQFFGKNNNLLKVEQARLYHINYHGGYDSWTWSSLESKFSIEVTTDDWEVVEIFPQTNTCNYLNL